MHSYTLRKDSLPSKYSSFDNELNRFYNVHGVDGVFTDFPDLAVAFVKQVQR